MDAYTLLDRIGAGSYSVVWRARERATGRVVAIKELSAGVEWAAAQALPEVAASRLLPAHEGLLRLAAAHRVGGRVFFVMEHCAGSLLDALGARARAGGGGASEAEARFVLRRLLAALAAVAGAGAAHRDVKPENILLAAGGRPVLADFGQLRRLDGGGGGALTPYVSTRWYRAPEVLLRAAGGYDARVDVWAAGCVLIELLTGRPAFPGASDADQFFRLCSALGPPSAASWPAGVAAAAAARFALPPLPAPAGAAGLLPPRASPAAAAAVAAMLTWDPARRPTAAAALATLAFFAPSLPEAPLPLAPPAARPAEEAAARADAAARQAALTADLDAAAAAAAGRDAERKEGDAGGGAHGGAGGAGGVGGGSRAAPRAAAPASDSDSDGASAPQRARGAGASAGAGTARSAARAAPPSFSPGGGGKEDSSDDGGGKEAGSDSDGGKEGDEAEGPDSPDGASAYSPSFR
jgi:protein kinase